MIKISNLNLNFHQEKIFENFSLEVAKGEKVSIIGASGTGKSTLINVITGFVTNYSGEVTVGGIPLNAETIKEIRNKFAYLPQNISLRFKSVRELFYAPFELNINKSQAPTPDEIREILQKFELSTTLLDKEVSQISGGEKQRIILASCLLLNKPILLVDEPTSALDQRIKEKITDFILDQKNLTILAVTHDHYWRDQSDTVFKLSARPPQIY